MKDLIMTHKIIWVILIIFVLLLLFPIGCIPGKESARGFRIPEGNAELGKVAFVDLDCIRCHSISGVEDIRLPEMPRDIHIVLGGETTRVKNYGQLVTSVIYPSHVILPKYREDFVDRDGESEMADLTETMTVKQMIDLVTYLETTYEVVPPPSSYDMMYP